GGPDWRRAAFGGGERTRRAGAASLRRDGSSAAPADADPRRGRSGRAVATAPVRGFLQPHQRGHGGARRAGPRADGQSGRLLDPRPPRRGGPWVAPARAGGEGERDGSEPALAGAGWRRPRALRRLARA